MGLNLITRAEYKDYAQISPPTHDQEISNLIPKVSELIKTYCKRTFVDYYNEDKVEEFNGGTEKFILLESPITDVAIFETSNDFGQTWSEVAEFSGWTFDENYVYSTSRNGFPRLLKGYRITYSGGYENIPSDLKLAAMDLVTYYRRNDMAIHSPKAPGSNSVQIEYITNANTGLPIHIRRILDLYKADFS